MKYYAFCDCDNCYVSCKRVFRKTALDFAKHHKDWVRLTFYNINIMRTWQELNGEYVVPNEELAKKKSRTWKTSLWLS